jgi:copper chaperone
MTAPDPRRSLNLVRSTGGGCACCRPTESIPSSRVRGADQRNELSMTTSSYQVTGMTCGHCVNAVSSELQGLDGVQDVTVDLNADGASTVTVTSAAPVQREQVVAALDEAGDYHLLDA